MEAEKLSSRSQETFQKQILNSLFDAASENKKRTHPWINPETNKFYLLPSDRKTESHFSKLREYFETLKRENKPGIYLSLPVIDQTLSSSSDEEMVDVSGDVFV